MLRIEGAQEAEEDDQQTQENEKPAAGSRFSAFDESRVPDHLLIRQGKPFVFDYPAAEAEEIHTRAGQAEEDNKQGRSV